MTISTIEESEVPEYLVPFTLCWVTTANSTVVVELCAAGHHPKCRITRGQATPLVIG